MFTMKIKGQTEVDGKTQVSGNAEYDCFPESVEIDGKCYEVFRTYICAKNAMVQLDIEKASEDLVGKTAQAK